MSNIASDSNIAYFDHVLTIKQFFNRHRHGSYIFAVSYSFALKKEVNREVIAYCNEIGLDVGEASIAFDTDPSQLLQLQTAKAQFKNGLILTNIDELMLRSQSEFVHKLNQMREALLELHIPILIWLTPDNHNAFTHKGIDLYTRRSLDTLFFPEIKQEDTNYLLERSEMKLDQNEDAETLRTRIFLLEKQLEASRQDDVPKSRIAKEIVFPLTKTYEDLLMLNPALELINEFYDDFDLNDPFVLQHFGNINLKAGNLDSAILFFEKALKINIQNGGKNSINVCFDYNDISEVWRQKGNINKAIKYIKIALAIGIQIFGENDSRVATLNSNLGNALVSKGDTKRGIKYLERALAIDIKLSGSHSSSVAIIYNNLGTAWAYTGFLEKAIEYYEKALKIDLQIFGNTNPNVAIRFKNLGNVYRVKGNLNVSLNYIEKALETNLKIYGDGNPEVAKSYDDLGIIWYMKGDSKKALEYYIMAYDIFIKTFGSEHNETKETAKRIYQIENIKQQNN